MALDWMNGGGLQKHPNALEPVNVTFFDKDVIVDTVKSLEVSLSW